MLGLLKKIVFKCHTKEFKEPKGHCDGHNKRVNSELKGLAHLFINYNTVKNYILWIYQPIFTEANLTHTRKLKFFFQRKLFQYVPL